MRFCLRLRKHKRRSPYTIFRSGCSHPVQCGSMRTAGPFWVLSWGEGSSLMNSGRPEPSPSSTSPWYSRRDLKAAPSHLDAGVQDAGVQGWRRAHILEGHTAVRRRPPDFILSLNAFQLKINKIKRTSSCEQGRSESESRQSLRSKTPGLVESLNTGVSMITTTSHWSYDFFKAQTGAVSRSMSHSQREAEIWEGASSYLLYKLSPLFWVACVLDSQARLV